MGTNLVAFFFRFCFVLCFVVVGGGGWRQI